MPGQGGVANIQRSLPGSLRRAREILRQGGFRLLLVKVLGETVHRRAVIMAFDLVGASTPPPARIAFDVEFLDEREIDEFLDFHPFARRDEIVARFERGERCLVARRRGRLVSAQWAAPRGAPIADLEVWPRLAPGEIYVYDAFTDPAFRGWGAYPAVADGLVRRFAQEGYVRMVGVVRIDADRAKRNHEQSGARRFGSVGSFRLGSFRRDLWLFRPDPRAPGTTPRQPWRSLKLCSLELGNELPPQHAGTSLEFGDLSEPELDQYVAFRPEANPDEMRSRFVRGERCVVMRHDGRIVSCLWVATRGTYDSQHACWIRLARGEAYVYDGFTTPEYPRASVGSDLVSRVQYELSKAGAERVVIPASRSSRRTPGVAVRRTMGRAGRVAIGHWEREFVFAKRER